MQVSVSDRKKILSTRQFVKECLKKEIFSPSEMSRRWNEQYRKKKEAHVFTKAMRRLGVSAKDRLALKHEAMKDRQFKDIEEYDEVKRYVAFSKGMGQITDIQITYTLRDLRVLWDWMKDEGHPNPREWNIDVIVEVLEKHIPKDEYGRWKQRGKVYNLLGAFNRTFQGILPKGYSTGLKREAGELKDFMRIEELQEFLGNLEHGYGYHLLMWTSLYTGQVNAGAREGTTMKTGILSLKWENIDFQRRRCNIRDKGKKGHPARLWKNVPLDLFPFLHGWEALLEWHRTQFGYYPTKTRHGNGRVFPVNYDQYRIMFNDTRHKCKSRISQDLETMRPHIFRQTHAQWLCNFGVPIEWICGQFPNGWYGVGWDDPKVLLRYYIDLGLASDKRLEIDNKMSMRMEKLSLSAPLITWKNVAFGDNATLAM